MLALVRPPARPLARTAETKQNKTKNCSNQKLPRNVDIKSSLKPDEKAQRWLLSSKGDRSVWDASFADGDWLIFGSETKGIDESVLRDHPGRVLRIPQAPDERCLNLATAAGIVLYEALRQIAPRRA